MGEFHQGGETAIAGGATGFRLGRAFGIPIYVHTSWLIVFGLVSWTLATGYFPSKDPELSAGGSWARALVASLLFFASILLHELGHSLIALRQGIPIHSITLFVFGGVARMARDPDTGKAEFRIAAAGPAVSLLLAGVFYAASHAPFLGAAAGDVTRYLAGINLAVALFNLVPAFPLDGGRLLRGLLWPAAGKLRATRLASVAGAAFGWLLIGLGAMALVGGRPLMGVWYLLLGWFLKDAARGAYRQVQLDEGLRDLTVADAMVTDVPSIPNDISIAEAAHASALRTGHGIYPVMRGTNVVGVVRLEDLVRVPFDEREGTSVQAVMRPLDEAITIAPEAPLGATFTRLAATPGGQLLVVSGGRLLGRLSGRDVARLAKVRETLA